MRTISLQYQKHKSILLDIFDNTPFARFSRHACSNIFPTSNFKGRPTLALARVIAAKKWFLIAFPMALPFKSLPVAAKIRSSPLNFPIGKVVSFVTKTLTRVGKKLPYWTRNQNDRHIKSWKIKSMRCCPSHCGCER